MARRIAAEAVIALRYGSIAKLAGAVTSKRLNRLRVPLPAAAEQ
jgi:hypothetical protein